MRRIIWLVFFTAFLLMPGQVGAGTYQIDLGLKVEDVRFSQDMNSLLPGQKLRVYASVFNSGTKDASGYISFFLNDESNMIGSAEVSAVSGGYFDEVFTDFTVPVNDFRIEILLLSVVPKDENPANDIVLTQRYVVQSDNDHDGIADNLDADDDNDGLSDDAELALGTDKDKADTDGDGVNDAADAFPLDPTKSKKELPKPVPEPEVTPAPKVAPEPVKVLPAAPAVKNPEPKKILNIFNKKAEEEKAELVQEFYNSPQVELLNEVRMDVTQVNWNTFNFAFSTNVSELNLDKLEYAWFFGDGKESIRNGNHTFRGSGEYFATLKVKGPWGNYLYDGQKVVVAFWSVYNYWLWLIVLCFVLIFFLYAYGFKHTSESTTQPGDESAMGGEKKRELRKPKTKQE